jgi:ribose transport system ATP-binding protein
VNVEVRGIEKSFGKVSVLRGVSFSVERGHVHALLGENGAGKSTLMRILIGLEKSDRGEVRIGGRAYVPGVSGPSDARRAGVVMVPQERTLCPHLTVLENMVLGVEPARFGIVDARRAEATAKEALGLVAADRIDLHARAGDLSVAEQQLVEIARALVSSTKPALLILDEPTSSLGKEDSDRLFERIHSLAESGVAVLLVTHFLADVRLHADRYTVLRDGQVAGEGDAKTTPPEQLVSEMLSRDLEKMVKPAESRRQRELGDVLLTVTNLRGAAKPRRATFELRRGEILGIAGLVGSGRTELFRAVIGLDEKRAGTVVLRGARGIGLLSEDRGGEGLMLARSIADNVTLTPRGPMLVWPSQTHAAALSFIRDLGIRTSGPDQPAGELSGGNQQKVQIARILREDYDVLLCDEPTRGIDVAAKAQVLSLFKELASRGKGIVLVSSQLDELTAVCDRICVLRNGELGESRPAAEWTQESLLLEAAS